ncbi:MULTISPECIES: Mu-like prophage major head subunit gpT family protein [unclassified Moraxella]|uniref:Mu-like prophage major head subunit gpT family protein n=1 Tax=unclassified Moraxella TaxID=2685852 RepID=UPI003AF87980
MQINQTTLNTIATGLNMTFNNAFKATETNWQKMAMSVPSTGKLNTYAWLDKFPAMREWIGDKVINKLKAQGYQIVNKDFESTIEVHRNDIEDDNIGQYGTLVEQATWSAAQLPDELIADLLKNGHVNLCYDEKPFFASDHEVLVNGKKTKYSNLGKKKLSVASKDDAETSYGVVRTKMREIKDEFGRSLKVLPTLLVVPPALEGIAKKLLMAEKFDDGSINIYKGTAELLVLDDLDTDNEWYLLDEHMPVKPLILQIRKIPTFVKQTGMDSDDVFNRATFKFGVEARYGAGYSFWQLAYKSTGEE